MFTYISRETRNSSRLQIEVATYWPALTVCSAAQLTAANSLTLEQQSAVRQTHVPASRLKSFVCHEHLRYEVLSEIILPRCGCTAPFQTVCGRPWSFWWCPWSVIWWRRSAARCLRHKWVRVWSRPSTASYAECSSPSVIVDCRWSRRISAFSTPPYWAGNSDSCRRPVRRRSGTESASLYAIVPSVPSHRRRRRRWPGKTASGRPRRHRGTTTSSDFDRSLSVRVKNASTLTSTYQQPTVPYGLYTLCFSVFSSRF